MKKVKLREADLHIHSHFSDGDCSVEELVKRIKRAGLKAAALTDHDKIDGQELFLKLCKRKNIDAVSGIELSTTFKQSGVPDAELHILGYDFDLRKLQADKKILAYNIQSRQRQIAGLLSRYRQQEVFSTSAEKIEKMFELPHPVINHYWVSRARAIDMLKKSEKHLSFLEARKIAGKEIKKDGPFNFPRGKFLPTEKAIRLIKSANGLAVWAHPTVYTEFLQEKGMKNFERILDKTLAKLKSFGLDGLEGFTERNSGAETKWLIKLCQKHGLNPYFGGTDYHGHKITEHKPGRYLGKGGIKYKEFAKNFDKR